MAIWVRIPPAAPKEDPWKFNASRDFSLFSMGCRAGKLFGCSSVMHDITRKKWAVALKMLSKMLTDSLVFAEKITEGGLVAVHVCPGNMGVDLPNGLEIGPASHLHDDLIRDTKVEGQRGK